MVLRNFVILEEGVPAVMHFYAHRLVPREITDPQTLQPKTIRVLEFDVDYLNGEPVASAYSVTSEKHAADFVPYLGGDRYKNHLFTIVRTGRGYRTQYEVQPSPWTPPASPPGP